MKPIEIACRECAAQPGEPCGLDGNGHLFHAERIEDAATWTTGDASPPSKESFDAAVDKTGLV